MGYVAFRVRLVNADERDDIEQQKTLLERVSRPPVSHTYSDAFRKERDSANAVPTNRNYTTELSAFGIIAGVNPAEVQ